MHYFKFNIGDYASHTRHLSLMEDLAYRRLLDLAYTTEMPITSDLHALSRLINMREQKTEINDVLEEFFISVEEGWIHNRVLKEMEETGGRVDKAKTAAKARWEKQKHAQSMLTHCLSDATSINNNTPSKENDATHYPLPITQDTDKPKRKRSATCNIQTFLDDCKEKNIERIPKDDPIFDFAEKNNIPMDMIRVCWQQFVRTHKESGKRQKDWRSAFRNCVRGNWYKFWFVEADGTIKETSQYRALRKDLGGDYVS